MTLALSSFLGQNEDGGNQQLNSGELQMRSTFQILVFFVYLAALGWGGWYVFSGQLIADRNIRNAPVPIETVPTETASDEASSDTSVSGDGVSREVADESVETDDTAADEAPVEESELEDTAMDGATVDDDGSPETP